MSEAIEPCPICPWRQGHLTGEDRAAIDRGELRLCKLRHCHHDASRYDCHGARAFRLATAPRTRLLLVGCGKSKLPVAAPARELYTGSLFQARRRHADATGLPWWVISALHHLVQQDALLEPYDLALKSLSPFKRTGWGCVVADALRAEIGQRGLDVRLCDIEVHAGAAYADALRPWLGAQIITPLEGLGVGQQLAWYAANLPKP